MVLKRNCIIIFYRLISQDDSRRAYFALRTISIFTKLAGYFDNRRNRKAVDRKALKDGNYYYFVLLRRGILFRFYEMNIGDIIYLDIFIGRK